MPDVTELDELPSAQAAALLRACCGASRWVEAMVARRPFHDVDTVLAESDDVWWSLDADDWLEAFAHHPRIGERANVHQDARASSWSAGEQAAASSAHASVQERLVDANRAYEARFGHIYIVCATGKSAEEMLDIARSRLANDAETELRVAAGEQAKITRLRLEKLLATEPS